MIANHIHDALDQVDRMKAMILNRRRFRGYSGLARMFGGAAALGVTIILNRLAVDQNPLTQLKGWMILLGSALLLNYGGLAYWYFRHRRTRNVLMELRPALEVVPALSVGAFLSLALVLREEYNLLFGVWMCLYGLAHMGYRHTLPRGIIAVGFFYQIAGIACLLAPTLSFLNPWPMGVVFLIGETAGGWILRED